MIKCCGIFGIIIFIILMSLFIASFNYINYDEYAFRKNTLSNKIDQTKIYTAGRYFWGVNFEKVAFPRLYRKKILDLEISNKEGLSVDIDISFWYKIQHKDVKKLYTTFGNTYESQIDSISTAAIRNTAVEFSINEYLTNRRNVTYTMAQQLSNDLSTIMFVDVPQKWINLGFVVFSSTVISKQLEAAVVLETNLKKKYQQTAADTRATTLKLVEEINKNITIITRTAQANKTALIKKSESEYEQILGNARGAGLTTVINALGLNDDATIKKFLKLMAILDNTGTQLIDVNSVIINAN